MINRHLTYLNTLDTLLGSLPSRKQLRSVPQFSGKRKIKVRVERTMPFEYIFSVMKPFLALWDADVKIDLSPYDNSFSSIGGDASADVFILWSNWRLYRESMTEQAMCDWLKERILTLRSRTDKPIFVNNMPEPYELEEKLFSLHTGKRKWIRQLNEGLFRLSNWITDCWIIDLSHIALELGKSFFDSRNENVSQYPFSDQATIAIARHLSVHLLPAVLLPRIKAFALDLDDTLYSGVLGEDGVNGVTLSDAHLRLQQLLLQLKQSGIMLTICSRNEERDVRELFQQRTDFPLQWKDFAVICANWHAKSQNLITISQKLNIDLSAMLYIDDNPAELLKVAGHHPTLKLLQADPSGEQTVIKLSHYPGCYQLSPDDSAAIRTADIQANQAREKLKSQASDYSTYLKSLQMVVRIAVNDPTHVNRVFEMSHKTNQFNLALQRMSKTEVEHYMKSKEYLIMTVQLSDILSDSGIIGTFVCRVKQEKAMLIEVLFSCRALGREIETISFTRLLHRLMRLGIKQLKIEVREGPRNAPARQWLKRFVNDPDQEQNVVDLFAKVSVACQSYPVKVEEIS